MLLFCKLLQKSVAPRIMNRGNKITKLLFGKYLMVTNTVSSGLLMFAGDLVQQEIEFQTNKLEKRYDWGRSARMTFIGTLFGPLHHWYYRYLDKILPKSDLITVSKKIILDQVVASPVCIIIFFYGMGILERKTYKEYHNEFKSKFFTVYVMDCCIWPPSQFINFYYIPSKYRVLYINFITTLYDVFLSYIKHVDVETSEKLKLRQS